MRQAVAVGVEAEGADDFFDVVGWVGDAADAGVEIEVLGHGEEICGVELGADSEF